LLPQTRKDAKKSTEQSALNAARFNCPRITGSFRLRKTPQFQFYSCVILQLWTDASQKNQASGVEFLRERWLLFCTVKRKCFSAVYKWVWN